MRLMPRVLAISTCSGAVLLALLLTSMGNDTRLGRVLVPVGVAHAAADSQFDLSCMIRKTESSSSRYAMDEFHLWRTVGATKRWSIDLQTNEYVIKHLADDRIRKLDSVSENEISFWPRNEGMRTVLLTVNRRSGALYMEADWNVCGYNPYPPCHTWVKAYGRCFRMPFTGFPRKLF